MASLNDNVRTDADAVTEIFDTELPDETVQAHINAAASVVDEIEEADDTVKDQRLELIETYVAAHFTATQDPRAASEAIGDADFTYRGPTDTTQYWETATTLDPTGALASESVQASIEVPESR